MIDYGPLWDTMRNRQVSQYHLLQSGIDNKTLDSLKKNKEYHHADTGKAMQHHRLHAK